jgi:2-dehydro-3-deoxygluconokinase
MTRRFDLLGLGECMVELYADRALGVAPRLQRAYGGDVLNALVAASRLGAKTGFISRVGDDPFGPGLLAAWQAEGIDTECAPLVAGENGVYFISLSRNGEREFTYRRSQSAATYLSPKNLNTEYLIDTRWLLLSGITQAISASARAATFAAAQIAKRNGVQVAYDPNYRPRLWAEHGGAKTAQQAFAELLPYVDCLLPSFPADCSLLEELFIEPESALRALTRQVPTVAMKCGKRGCIVGSQDSFEEVPAVAAAVADTTGAGDAWNGTFLFSFMRGSCVTKAAQHANRYAAAKLAHRGAIPPSIVSKVSL